MRKGSTTQPWLARMLNRKPPMLVIVALANKMARIAWALMARGETYRAPAIEKCSPPLDLKVLKGRTERVAQRSTRRSGKPAPSSAMT